LKKKRKSWLVEDYLVEVGWGSNLGVGGLSVGNWGSDLSIGRLSVGNWLSSIGDLGDWSNGLDNGWGRTVDDGVESVDWVSGVGNGTDGTIGLNKGVLSLDNTVGAGLGSGLGVSGQTISNRVSVAVLWVGVEGLGGNDGLGNGLSIGDGSGNLGVGWLSVGDWSGNLGVGRLSVGVGGLSIGNWSSDLSVGGLSVGNWGVSLLGIGDWGSSVSLLSVHWSSGAGNSHEGEESDGLDHGDDFLNKLG
jgi:hypothetical protein